MKPMKPKPKPGQQASPYHTNPNPFEEDARRLKRKGKNTPSSVELTKRNPSHNEKKSIQTPQVYSHKRKKKKKSSLPARSQRKRNLNHQQGHYNGKEKSEATGVYTFTSVCLPRHHYHHREQQQHRRHCPRKSNEGRDKRERLAKAGVTH